MYFSSISSNTTNYIKEAGDSVEYRGTYEKGENNVYKIKSDKQEFKIILNTENSFEIVIKNLTMENQFK